MPLDSLYGNKYKYILSRINAASRFKVERPLRTKQAKDVAEMITDIYKVGPLMYSKIFQCNNGSKFKAEVTKLLEKHEVRIQHAMTKYKHTHTASVEALNKMLTERLFKVQDAQELNDPNKVSVTWVRNLYGLVDELKTQTQMTGMKLKDAIKMDRVPLVNQDNYPEEDTLPEDGMGCISTYYNLVKNTMINGAEQRIGYGLRRLMSQSIPTGYIPPGQPPGISSKNLPRGSGFDF